MNLKKTLLISMTAALFSLGLSGCGGNENNDQTPEKQQNNHSDINEGTDKQDSTGTNQEEQVEVDPNDGGQ